MSSQYIENSIQVRLAKNCEVVIFCTSGEFMISGIGIDILKVDRIKTAIDRHGKKFTDRVFTRNEQEYCIAKSNTYESLAARFSVKEAAFKSLGRGWDECGGFTSVEVVSDDRNRPSIVFHGRAKQFADSLNIQNVYVSITHHAGLSAAVVILEK